MTTSNAAVDTAAKTGAEKVHDKLAEKRRALGRGLESLLPGPRVLPSATEPVAARAATPVAVLEAPADSVAKVPSMQTPDGQTVYSLAIDLIDDNPYQTRRDFNEAALNELTASIGAQGVIQPIVVRPGTEGRFILILGERRLRASKLAGKTTIPVVVKRVSEQQAAEMTLVENLQRQDLGCIEQADAFSTLSTQFHLTQEQIGKRVGVSREQVSNYMRLLNLPEGVISALQKGLLTYSHARTLLQLRDNGQISRIAQKVIAEKMSVAKLEELVFGASVPVGGGPAKVQGGARWLDPNVKAAQRSLETVLGMKVRIRDRNGRGKILIEYGTIEDFDRVVRMLKGK
jgi:ParB family transcriptional regulator, chromosome partitioning protein